MIGEIGMLNIFIICLIVVALILHRYLTAFHEMNILPYSWGFLLFANIFAVVYAIHFVWMFGIILGVVVFLLTFFQVVYGAVLWVFLLPFLTNISNKPETVSVSLTIYGLWSFIIIGLGSLAIMNVFVSDYGDLGNNIISAFRGNYITAAFWLVGVLIAGHTTRIYISYLMGLTNKI